MHAMSSALYIRYPRKLVLVLGALGVQEKCTVTVAKDPP